MHLWRARSLSSTLRRHVWVLALVGLIGGVLLMVPAATAHASDYTASNLPDWAIGPFTRQPQPNPAPVLTPAAAPAGSRSTCSTPASSTATAPFQMLYRADGGGPDQIGLATSTDGLNFTRNARQPGDHGQRAAVRVRRRDRPAAVRAQRHLLQLRRRLQLVQQPAADHHGDHLHRPGPLDHGGADRAHQLRPRRWSPTATTPPCC